MTAEDQHAYRFTDHEATVLRGLVRDHLRRTVRKAHAGRAKFGSEWDPDRNAQRIAVLRSIYTALGGDPDRIANVWPYPDPDHDTGE